jgi:DNA (cytosine-5)-methyltransferase 1
MTRTNAKRTKQQAVAVDLFCGAGGLTRGLLDAGIAVAVGYDIDEACRFPYEQNNSPAIFKDTSVRDLTGKKLAKHYAKGQRRILVGCAPCVTFSKYTQGQDRTRDPKWQLLRQFARLIREVKPDVISMENVPELQRHNVFKAFLRTLSDEGYHFSDDAAKRVVYCPDYGIPQHRSRLVIVASRLGPIELIPPTHRPKQHRTVKSALKSLPSLQAGEQSTTDPMHRASKLSALNLRRIQHSTPGGTWRDWPDDLVAKCHKKKKGKGFGGVYGRMEWDRPSPTITTQFFGFGNGRFGHPEQDRGLSLREGAILQSFPIDYQFTPEDSERSFKAVGRMIGNAVPVRLGEIIGKTILQHLEQHAD